MYENYTVKDGDTLEKIAINFSTTSKDIIDVNNLKPVYQVKTGDILKVPNKTTSAFIYYTIKKGDNIYSIAKRYNINMQNLLQLNNLNANSYIYPGQKILVPNEGVAVYLTKMGDSVNTIMSKSNNSYDDLLLYNDRLYLLPDQLIVYKMSDNV